MTNLTTASLAAPVGQQDRIQILDSLRGIAILGILMMNIPGFAFPEIMADDPSVMNETGINYKTWFFVDWFLAGTQRAFFSMLFGAGIILFVSNLEKRLDGTLPAEYFFRRQLWLLVFGLFNAFILLWFWDILYGYAICGMILFAFRRLSPKNLMIAALCSVTLMTARSNLNLYRDKQVITRGELVAAIDTSKITLNEVQKENLTEMREFKEKSGQEAKMKEMKKEMRMVNGDYASLYKVQSDKSLHVELYYTYFLIWDMLLFMLLGMAFYKNGILIAKGSSKIYWLMFIAGLGIGLLLSYFRLQPIIENKFNEYEYIKTVSFDYSEIARLFRSLGLFGLIMLMYKSGWFNWFFSLMRPVGQMAFTNYLTQSLMCGLFFYGIGGGYFGQMQRYEIYIVMGIVWIIQICWSHAWLHYFRFGPLEWLWRSLTYWKKQPFRKNEELLGKKIV